VLTYLIVCFVDSWFDLYRIIHCVLKIKVDYLTMLKEMTNLSRHSSWTKTKEKLASDSRYKAVESSSKREDWFRDYIKYLDDQVTVDLNVVT